MMVCHEGNQAAFRAALKAQLPEAHDLAIALYRAGLIDGLRGMALAPVPPGLPWPAGVPVTLSLNTEKRLIEQAWRQGEQR